MKLLISLTLAALTSMSCIASDTLTDLANRLASTQSFASHATYTVMLPSMPDDVVYSIDLFAHTQSADTLAGMNYLIEWSLPTPSGISSGFNSYHNGNHFRYRDNRLQEYHFEWDSIPFQRGGGVQRQAQFVDILPQSLSASLLEMAADPEQYPAEISKGKGDNGNTTILVKATRQHDGLTVREITMTFDAETALPLRLEYENNPGAISEQTVTVTYSYPAHTDAPTDYSEESLIDRHPDTFERFRQSNFRIENLPGTPLPTFSLPTTTAQRYTYNRLSALASPTVIALIDPSTTNARATVDALRKAVDSLPMNVDLILAFTSTSHAAIDDVAGNARLGETLLMSARSLARDLGVTAFPSLVFVNRDGKIADVQIGFNKELSTVVIQKAALLK